MIATAIGPGSLPGTLWLRQSGTPILDLGQHPILAKGTADLTADLHLQARHLPATEKQNLIDTIYLPYRNRVEKAIAEAQKPTLHLSIHTFTPVFNNQTRTVDIGLLFDPGRHSEKEFCEAFIHKLSDQFPHLTLRFNEPYQGIDDGLTTYLRTRFDASAYLGIEIEVNQKWCAAAQDMAKGLATALWQ